MYCIYIQFYTGKQALRAGPATAGRAILPRPEGQGLPRIWIKHELCQVTACVVTKAEHKLLDVHNKSKDLQEEPDSWDRYANAQIRVYDRLEKQWLPSNFSARALDI